MLQKLPPEVLNLVLQRSDLASLLTLHQVLPHLFSPFHVVFQTIYVRLVPYVWSIDDLDDLQSLLAYQINETQQLNHMPLVIFLRFVAKYNYIPERLIIDLWQNFVLLRRLQPALLTAKKLQLTVLGWIPLTSADYNNLDCYRFTSIKINSTAERHLLQNLPSSLKSLELDLDSSQRQPVVLGHFNLKTLTLTNDENLNPRNVTLICPNLRELHLTISNKDMMDWCEWLCALRATAQLESLILNIKPASSLPEQSPIPALDLVLPEYITNFLLKLANLDLFECPCCLDFSESTSLTSLVLENVIASQLKLPENLSKLVIDINHDNGFRMDSFKDWKLPNSLVTFELHSSWFIELFDLRLPKSVSILRLVGIPVEKWEADLNLPNLQTAVIVTSRVSDTVEDPPALKAFLTDEKVQTHCVVGPFHTTYYISSMQFSTNEVFKEHQALIKHTEERDVVRITSIADFFHFPSHIDSINVTLHQPDLVLLRTFGEFLLGSKLTRLSIEWHSNSFSEVLLPQYLKDCSIKAHTPIQVSDFHTPTSEGLDTIFNTKNCLGLRRLEIVGVRSMTMDFNKFPDLHTLITDSDIYQEQEESLGPFVHVKNLKCLQPIAGLQNVDFELFPNLQTLDCQLPMANASLRFHNMQRLSNLRMSEHQFTFTSIPCSLPASLRVLHFTTIGDNLRLDARQCHSLFVISFQLLQVSVIKSLIDSLPSNNSLNAICPYKDLGNLYEGGYEYIRRHFPKLVPLINLGPVPQSTVFDTSIMCK